MTDIYNSLTYSLMSENMSGIMELGIMSILFGFAFCSLLTVFSYGVNQVKCLFNV